jgi:hypothetical protein
VDTPLKSDSRILVRATRTDERLLDHARLLHEASGHPVTLLVDARFAEESAGLDMIPVERAKLEAMGLYCPNNFAWRCGDYGFYLARLRHPEARHFWMIEHDVRFSEHGLPDFFRRFDEESADLLVTRFSPAEPNWYWTAAASARDARPYRCLFPISRVSAGAIDILLSKRRSHSADPLRRLFWPNDEVFVATTLHGAGLHCRDFNDFGAPVHDEQSFGFFEPIDGEHFQRELALRPGFRIFHPVLFGEEYERKVRKLNDYAERSERWKRLRNGVLGRINGFRLW